jgi:hypothetical protein
MNNTFELKKGKLVFEDDKIVITDNAKYEKRYRLFSSCLLLFLGLSFLMDFRKTVDTSFTRLGLLFVAAGLVNLAFEYFKSVQSEISYKEVKSIKLNRIFSRDVLFIKLNNNKTRRVNGIYNAERLVEYMKTISIQE